MGKVLLYCMCFLALTAFLHAASLSMTRCHEFQKVVKMINKYANKTHPHSFHVPVNVQSNCLNTALTCFRSQTNKLHVATGKSKADFEKYIRKVMLSKPDDREECTTPCFNYTKQSPQVFLNEMDILLKQIISRS